MYLAIKVIHIAGVVLWIGSFITVCHIAGRTGMKAEQVRSAIRISDTSIGVVWLAGLALMFLGQWYVSVWIYVKLVFVVVISAIHTVMHRRWKSSGDVVCSPVIAPALFLFAVTAIFIVVTKIPAW